MKLFVGLHNENAERTLISLSGYLLVWLQAAQKYRCHITVCTLTTELMFFHALREENFMTSSSARGMIRGSALVLLTWLSLVSNQYLRLCHCAVVNRKVTH